MKTTYPFRDALLLCTALATLIPAARAQQALPDAPHPQGTSNRVILARGHWSDVVEPGQKTPPFTTHEKLLFPLHEELRVTTPLVLGISAGYGVLTDSNPKYGTNPEDFGKRIGAAALDQAITRELTDSLLPIVFHEDPRYYRQAGGTYVGRFEHVIRRVFIAQSDSGRPEFNYSDVLGRGMAAALTQTYYPQRSIGTDVVFKSWGTSIGALAGGNFYEEFWPDVRRKLFHKND